jgi:hypothetical protein
MTPTDVTSQIPALFEHPRARRCIEIMQAWMNGEPVWPYARIIEDWGAAFEDMRRQISRHFERLSADLPSVIEHDTNLNMALYAVRAEYVGRWGFLIPCAELMDALAGHEPIVEVGAGSGYMTHLMRHRGIHVIGSDIEPPLRDSGHGFVVAVHDPEQVQIEAKTMVRRYPERTVFASWPTYSHTWLRQMMRAMAVGQVLIVTREDCIGSESAWTYLDNCFEELQVIDLPVFPYIHDYAGVYRKVRQNEQGKSRRASLLGGRRQLSRRAAAKDKRRTQKAT